MIIINNYYRDDAGKTARDYAVDKNFPKIVKLIDGEDVEDSEDEDDGKV